MLAAGKSSRPSRPRGVGGPGVCRMPTEQATTELRRSGRRRALVILIAYLLGGYAWIFLSDWALFDHIQSHFDGYKLGLIKGLAFVTVTGLLIYAFARRSLDEMAASREASLKSDLRFRRIWDSDIMGLFVWQPDGTISEANDSFCSTLGLTQDHVKAGHASWLRLTPLELREQDQQQLKNLLATGACPPYQKEFFRADGSRVPVIVGGAMIGGGVGDGVGFLLDITQQKAAEARIQALNDELATANHRKDEFLATLSHELRTPVTAIRLWTQILGRSLPAGEEAAEASAMIRQSAEAQSRLIEDLLDISRITMGRLRLNMQPADLVLAVERAVQAHRPIASEAGVHMAVDLPATPHRAIQADEKRITQVVDNLLSNAIKFTPAEGTVSVKLEYTRSAGAVAGEGGRPGELDMARITVTDTGQGIPPEFLSQMFQRFRQADTSTTRKHGGLGLGLSICKHLVEAHGGTIRGESEGPGKGATFTVELPLLPSTQAAPAARPLIPPKALAGCNVLVVEDDEFSRAAIVRVLRDAGASVDAAPNVAEGLDAMNGRRYHCILSDIGMPDQDGVSFIRAVRKREADHGNAGDGNPPHTPAVAVTAYAMQEDRERALNAGFDAYLVKPVEPFELIEAVRKHRVAEPAGA
jgi:PAS domain S-box-containing protein